MKKTLRNLLLSLVAGFALVGCGKIEEPENPSGPTTPTAQEYREETVADTTLKGLGAGKKIYLTTIGQGSVTIAEGLLEEAGVTFTREDYIEASACEKGSVVVISVHHSGKALGGSVTPATEKARCEAFAAAAKAGDIDVIVMFLGGKQARGTNTDGYLTTILPESEVAIVWDDESPVNGANLDGKLATFAKETPIYYFADENDSVDSLAFILK